MGAFHRQLMTRPLESRRRRTDSDSDAGGASDWLPHPTQGRWPARLVLRVNANRSSRARRAFSCFATLASQRPDLGCGPGDRRMERATAHWPTCSSISPRPLCERVGHIRSIQRPSAQPGARPAHATQEIAGSAVNVSLTIRATGVDR